MGDEGAGTFPVVERGELVATAADTSRSTLSKKVVEDISK